MTQVCRPTPFVRFMHSSETWLKTTPVSHGTTLEHGSIFTSDPTPENPTKGYFVEKVH
jgi:hypothetical protein